MTTKRKHHLLEHALSVGTLYLIGLAIWVFSGLFTSGAAIPVAYTEGNTDQTLTQMLVLVGDTPTHFHTTNIFGATTNPAARTGAVTNIVRGLKPHATNYLCGQLKNAAGAYSDLSATLIITNAPEAPVFILDTILLNSITLPPQGGTIEASEDLEHWGGRYFVSVKPDGNIVFQTNEYRHQPPLFLRGKTVFAAAAPPLPGGK